MTKLVKINYIPKSSIHLIINLLEQYSALLLVGQTFSTQLLNANPVQQHLLNILRLSTRLQSAQSYLTVLKEHFLSRLRNQNLSIPSVINNNLHKPGKVIHVQTVRGIRTMYECEDLNTNSTISIPITFRNSRVEINPQASQHLRVEYSLTNDEIRRTLLNAYASVRKFNEVTPIQPNFFNLSNPLRSNNRGRGRARRF